MLITDYTGIMLYIQITTVMHCIFCNRGATIKFETQQNNFMDLPFL